MHVHIVFFVVRKGYSLPTSYQNVGFISLIPTTCLLSFIHQSIILSKSYTKMPVHIVFCCGAKRVFFTNKLSEFWCHH